MMDGRGPAPGGRAGLGSPWTAGALAIVFIALVVSALVLPGLLRPGPGPAGTETPSPGTASTSPPPTTPAASATDFTPTPIPTPVPTEAFISYTVRSGDSLNSIAHQFETTGRSIAWWNRGTYPSLDPESPDYDPNHIEVGWVLALIPGTTVDDANPPTPSPGASVTPPPSAQPPPTGAPVGEPAAVVTHGARGTTMVALTFDMGGRLDPALDIVFWLIDHDVHATLFPAGDPGTTTEIGRSVLQLAASRPDLLGLGNHSWDHPNFTELTAVQMADQLDRTETAVSALIGRSTRPWFRPPYGAWTSDVRAGVGAAGWSWIVMWDLDTLDWSPEADGGPTTDDIVTKVVAEARGGSIVLMHLGGYNTLEALPRIVSGLKARGLQPVTLAEMLGG